MGTFDPMTLANFSVWMMLLTLWTIPWKGYALWKSARRGEKWWFIALFVINTAAILEILYIFVFSKERAKGEGGNRGRGEKGEETKV